MIRVRYSLKRWLMVSIFILFTLTYLVIGVFSYQKTRHEVDEIYDAQLISQAHQLIKLLKSGQLQNFILSDESSKQAGIARLMPYESKVEFELLDASNRVLFASHAGFRPPIKFEGALDSEDVSRSMRLANIKLNQEAWRLLYVSLSNGRNLILGESLEFREGIADEIAFRQVLPVLIGLPIFLFLISGVLNYGFRKLNRVSQNVAKQSPVDLKPISIDQVPQELSPLVSEINRLMARVRTTIEDEKRFTADAAHELRTPVAAMRLLVEGLYGAQSLQESHALTKNIDKALARMHHLAEQLLSLHKTNAENLKKEPVNLESLIVESIESLSPLMNEKQQILSYESEKKSCVFADKLMLQLLLMNVLSNAVKYTPVAGQIKISVVEEANGCDITIEDSGEGIPVSEYSNVFKRFYRQRVHQSEVNGCGLGFSIIEKVVLLHQAHILLDKSADLGGLKVVVKLPK